MGHTAIPSPTTFVDRLSPFLSSFEDKASNTKKSMDRPRGGQCGYSAAPAEDGALCNQNLLVSSSEETSMTSFWKVSGSIDSEEQQQNARSALTDFDLLSGDLEGKRTRNQPPNHPSTRISENIENHVLGNQKGDRRFEWDGSRSSRPRRRAGGRTTKIEKKLQFPDLIEPLSKWAKTKGIQPKDVHSFASRDIKKRVAQAIKNGYVKRNLNVFFLYKRAYGNVAQAWMEIHHPTLAKTQPPLVTLVGESWAKESAEFKQSYTFYSDLEKDGLRSAFPHYKYKPGAKKTQVGGTTSTKESPAFGAEHPGSHGRLEGWTEYNSHSQQPCGKPLVGKNKNHLSAQGQANDNICMSEPPTGLAAQCLPAPHELHYGPRTWSDSPEPASVIGGYGNTFLYPGHADWQTPFRGGTRSPSPACSHHSQQQMDLIPIDPGLPAAYTDLYPSRATSEEPGYVAPSQTFKSCPPDFVCPRAVSSEPMFEGPNELMQTTSTWPAHTMAFRSGSEERWQEAPDSILSSVPVGTGCNHHTLTSEGQDWNLETIEQDEKLQPFTWSLSDWAVDLDEGTLDRIH